MGSFLAGLKFWKTSTEDEERRYLSLDGLIDEWMTDTGREGVLTDFSHEPAIPHDFPKGEISGTRFDTFEEGPSVVSMQQDEQKGPGEGDKSERGKRDASLDILEFAEELSLLTPSEPGLKRATLQDVASVSRGTPHKPIFAIDPGPNLMHIEDTAVDDEQGTLRQIVVQRERELYKQLIIAKAPRRKRIDALRTVNFIARNGGLFRGFRYQPSPSRLTADTKPLELLLVGDVSGSMGRYIAVVLHLLTSLEKLANVRSYIFSDLPTYVGNPRKPTFRELHDDLQQRAKSWAYGTRLSAALSTICSDQRFTRKATVLLITDGGFSLVGNDWTNTVQGLIALRAATRRILVLTPNPSLVTDGPLCEARLWNVEKNVVPMHEIISSPERMKTARFGLLSRYSDGIIPCENAEDVRKLVEHLLEKMQS